MKIIAICPKCSTQYDVSSRTIGETIHCACGGAIMVAQPRAADARIVRCHSCGASRGASGSACEFCGAVFSAADKGWGSMCPQCFCRLPGDAQFCVECGLRIDPQNLDAVAKDSKLQCPRCTVHLQLRALEKVTIHECGACAGVWLSVRVFEEICRDRDTQAVATQGLSLARRRTKFEIPTDEQVKYIPCPMCKNLMNRHNFGHISGVIVDTCRDCGVWLDNQELNRIIRFIQDGGLERSRQLDLQEQKHYDQMRRSNKITPILGPDVELARSSAGTSMLTQVLKEVAWHFFT